MKSRLAIACAIAGITLLGFFQFPGHTYLQSDTQIYVPMLERIWDPSALPGDLAAAKPHLAYTIYDEVSIDLRWLTRTGFETVLMLQQFVFRFLEVLGIYLVVMAIPLPAPAALAVTAIASLGASIAGPAVLMFEYEPVPRGFAAGLVFLAIGLAANKRLTLASTAASVAFLYHAPTTISFWLCFIPWIIWSREWRALLPICVAAPMLLIAAHWQPGATERQQFFFFIDTAFAKLQRVRAGYNWISDWPASLFWQYLGYWLVALVAVWRMRLAGGRALLLGLTTAGALSVPVSYLLLDRLKWGLVPQIQPARALLFVSALALILSAAAGLRAASSSVWPEAILWLALAFAIPMQGQLDRLKSRQLLLALALALVTTLCGRWRPWLALAPAIAAYFLMPSIGQTETHSPIETADLSAIGAFARRQTPKESTWLFADAGRALYPGVFRARALRTVYVDWKSGGQVNFYRSLGFEWWERWTALNNLEYQPSEWELLDKLPVDYIVLRPDRAAPGKTLVYRNGSFAVYGADRLQLAESKERGLVYTDPEARAPNGNLAYWLLVGRWL